MSKIKRSITKPEGVLAPNLRFRSRQIDSAWHRVTLEQICQIQAGKFVSADRIKEGCDHSLFACYGGNGLRGYTATYTHEGVYPLIGRQGALCGNINLCKGRFHATEHALVVTPNEGIITEWLNYALQLLNLNQYAIGQAQPGLSVQVIGKTVLAVPPCVDEQCQIADCLTSLDALIDRAKAKLEALGLHKEGLMQRLFPNEGISRPKLRFHDFKKSPVWELRKAKELFVNRVEPGADNLPIYSVMMKDGMVKRSSLDRKIDDILEPTRNKKAYKGDIAYNMMRMWQGAFGVAPEDCMVSPAYVILQPHAYVCPEFIGYLFKLPQYLRLLTTHSQGITKDRLRLYYKDFAHIPIRIPALEEQQCIAACLASLDCLIAAQSQQLGLLTTHKTGLMQQLFPTPEL